MSELISKVFAEFHGSWYDAPPYGEGPTDGFAVVSQETDGNFVIHIQAFFATDGDRQAKYRVSYPKMEKADRIIAYELGGIGWIEEGQGATPFAACIGTFIQERFSGPKTR